MRRRRAAKDASLFKTEDTLTIFPCGLLSTAHFLCRDMKCISSLSEGWSTETVPDWLCASVCPSQSCPPCCVVLLFRLCATPMPCGTSTRQKRTARPTPTATLKSLPQPVTSLFRLYCTCVWPVSWPCLFFVTPHHTTALAKIPHSVIPTTYVPPRTLFFYLSNPAPPPHPA